MTLSKSSLCRTLVLLQCTIDTSCSYCVWTITVESSLFNSCCVKDLYPNTFCLLEKNIDTYSTPVVCAIAWISTWSWMYLLQVWSTPSWGWAVTIMRWSSLALGMNLLTNPPPWVNTHFVNLLCINCRSWELLLSLKLWLLLMILIVCKPWVS